MMDTLEYVHAEIVGTDKVSQFRGWVIFRLRTLSTYGITQKGVKKLWVDFFN